MAKKFTIDPFHWTKLAPGTGEDSDLVLSTSAARPVSHTEGRNGEDNCIVLRQFASDPSNPFTAGQLVFTASPVTFRDGTVVDLAHSDNYPRNELFDQVQPVAHTIHSGGFFIPGYRVPLEWRVAILAGTPSNFFEIELFRPDGALVDADDRTDVAFTIDYDVDDTGTTDIAVTDGIATPAASRGGGLIRKAVTNAQLMNLRQTPRKKIGLTIAAASSTPVETYSAYDDTAEGTSVWAVKLAFGATTFLQAPSSGAWYARMVRGEHGHQATLFVGE